MTTFSTIDHDDCLGFPHLLYECDDKAGDSVWDQRFWPEGGGEGERERQEEERSVEETMEHN